MRLDMSKFSHPICIYQDHAIHVLSQADVWLKTGPWRNRTHNNDFLSTHSGIKKAKLYRFIVA